MGTAVYIDKPMNESATPRRNQAQAHADLPSTVLELTTFFLDTIDAAAPGFIQGLYLTGSVALHDFQENSSDVDFVAVWHGRADDKALLALAAAHAAAHSRYPGLNFDGPHLSQADLIAGPENCPPAPFHYEGKFEPSGRYALNPVTWHELTDRSVGLRGPSLVGAPIWRDAAVLHTWTLNNLRDYWRPWLAQYQAAPTVVDTLDYPVTWGVLGVTRLHYTLGAGQITSKTGAGQYALGLFNGRWRPIITEALRLRLHPATPSEYADLSERRRDVVAYMEMVMDSVLK